jgi:hypothetical protein
MFAAARVTILLIDLASNTMTLAALGLQGLMAWRRPAAFALMLTSVQSRSSRSPHWQCQATASAAWRLVLTSI